MLDEEGQALASALHEVMLPAGIPVLPGVELAARFVLPSEPADPGGDWFDVVPLDSGRVALVVGTAVGSGTFAAAVMGQVRAVLRTALAHFQEPEGALQFAQLHASLYAEARGTTAAIVVLDPAAGGLVYCTAGHPPPLVAGADGSVRLLDVTGSGPLGSPRGFACLDAPFAADDLVVLFSPGLAPAVSAYLSVLGEQSGTGAGLGHDAEGAADLVLSLASGSAQTEIQTALVARAHSVPDAGFTLALTADDRAERSVRDGLGGWLDSLGVAGMDRLLLLHAVGELVTNVVDHAYSSAAADAARPVDLRGVLSEHGEVTVEVADHGSWHPSGGSAGRGRGIAMAAGLVDDVTVSTSGTGTVGVVRHRLSRPVPIAEGPRLAAATASVPLEISHAEPGTVHLSGGFGYDDADEATAELLLASSGATRDLLVDLTEVTSLSNAGVRVLSDLSDRYARSPEPQATLTLHAPSGTPARRALDLAHLPSDAA